MSTNPNNAVGTNAAYDGRTSVKAFNDGIGAYSRGILSGWACSPGTGMTVSLGGDGTTRDIAIAEDVSGNKITVNNISESPISVTMSAAPATNSRIDLIVAYVDNPPQGSATSIDNPGACGLIAVDGTAAANPVAPNDSAIRTAITADGASGSTAYYVVLAKITVPTGTTDLTSGNIKQGDKAVLNTSQIADGSITSSKINFATLNPVRKVGNQERWISLSGTMTDLLDRVYITTAGKYLVIARAFVDVTTLASYLSICKNTAILTNASENNAGQHSLVTATMEQFAVGDSVYVQGKTDGSGKYYNSRDRLEFIVIRVG